jgi:hypothetical protein
MEMRNLAGFQECDAVIMQELTEAGIDLVFHQRRASQFSEVPYTVTGELILTGGSFTFRRAWCYWVVDGKVPLALAEAMYAVEERRDVRVAGHCGCPPPAEWALPTVAELEWHIQQEEERREAKMSDSVREIFMASRCVDNYHIDTQEGLNFFAACMKARKVPVAA